MRFILVDWGTSRFRAFLIEGETILDRVSSEEGISALQPGRHAGVFRKHCLSWLEAEPDAPVALVGMVGSREGWRMAPYAACPAGPEDVAHALIEVDVGEGRRGHIVPGLTSEPQPGAIDVMRGEETLCFGAGVADGIVCLPGTHPKWVEMKGGRIERFATYFTGEMYALLRHHSMIGRPATEPEDPAGFDLGLAAAERNGGTAAKRVGLLHLIFGARAAAVTGRLSTAALGPYISGLLTGDEINGAFSLFRKPEAVTIVAEGARADLFAKALAQHGVEARFRKPEEALIAGLARVLSHRTA
jgi:2-dehydro-3-deoxygalactonokinase